MTRPNIIVFATGGIGPTEGGSGLQELINKEISWQLDAVLLLAVSSHIAWWVANKAKDWAVPFHHMEKPFTAEKYQQIIRDTNADLVALSGRIHLVQWIDPAKCINIHPWPLGKYGGKWMYGDHVHEKIYEDLKQWKIKRTCVTMHFVTPIYDDPQWLIFQCPVELQNDEEIMKNINDKQYCIQLIKKKVNKVEHDHQRYITNMVANKKITAQRDEEDQKIHIQFPQDYQRNTPVALDTQDPYENF